MDQTLPRAVQARIAWAVDAIERDEQAWTNARAMSALSGQPGRYEYEYAISPTGQENGLRALKAAELLQQVGAIAQRMSEENSHA